jgi:hypothetical protein
MAIGSRFIYKTAIALGYLSSDAYCLLAYCREAYCLVSYISNSLERFLAEDILAISGSFSRYSFSKMCFQDSAFKGTMPPELLVR